MNRYPLWKYITVLAALLIGLLYTLPNFFGESPAVQIAGAKSTVKIDNTVLTRVEDILKRSNTTPTGAYSEKKGTEGTVRVRGSEERRGGQECAGRGETGWGTEHSK